MNAFLKNILLFLLGILAFQYSHGQTRDSLKSSLHIKRVLIKDSLIIDSFSTDFNSFKIKDIPDSDYIFYPEQSLLIWKHRPKDKDSVTLIYRRLPISFNKRISHKSGKQVDTNIAFPFYSFSEQDLSIPKNFVQFNSIDYSGTYGRSMTIGNGQDASLNSNFNMQLNGYILDSVRIEAALSDNNVPFQPDGNTQRLQEFDQVYITFEKGGQKLTAGDYDLKKTNSYFMNFDKRVQGLYYQGNFDKNKKIQNKVGISGSVAKGEYARDIFQGSEGNQGPYKLTGNNGEQFFIVIAGSERVYVDGILLQRGQDKDYTIDYNMAEVTFMPTKMITKDSRIQVEFEYQNRNYLNTLLYVYDELNISNKWHFKLNAYSNQDSKNQSYLQDLDAAEKNFLKTIGDRIGDAYYPSYQVDTFAENKILYRMADTVVEGKVYDSVFIYSTNKDSTLYNLNFSFVGENKGDYVLSGSNTNGRSYRWVAPVNNVPQGNYTPMILLVTPKKQQMFTLSGDYQIDKNKEVGLELGATNYAPNLFATENKDPHWGFAGRGFYKETRELGKKSSVNKANWILENGLTYEWTQSNFKPIAPFRNVEFDRDWNLFDTIATANAPSDNLADFQTKLSRKNWGNLGYQFSWYQKGDLYQAQRHIINLDFRHGTLNGAVTYNFLTSKQDGLKTKFLRPSAFIEKSFPKIKDLILGVQWQQEHNQILNTDSNTLSAASYANNTYDVYLKNDDSKNVNFKLSYTLREDERPNPEGFTHLSYAQDFEVGLNIKQWKNQTISLTGTFRKLSTMDSSLINSAQGGKNILGRLQYNGLIKKGFILPVTLYEIGSGQQQKQEYTYVKVPTGQGELHVD